MKTGLFLQIVCLIALAVPALAEPAELHAVGVYEGNIRTNGRIHGAEVRIVVDRTEAPVILSLGSYEAVRWYISTTPGTRIETVYLSGYEPEKSEIYLNKVPLSATILDDLGYADSAEGVRFRQLVDRLTEISGLSELSSFHGSYRASEEPFVIDAVVKTPENTRDPLAHLVRPDLVPEALRTFLETDHKNDGDQVAFEYEGFRLTTTDGQSKLFPVTLDVPEPSWPSGATLDREGSRVFGVTHGGEGFLYQYDMAADQWSVLASMNNRDATGLIHDPDQNRLVLGLGRHNMGVAIFDLGTGRFRDLPLEHTSFPGLSHLYDVGNGPRPNLAPVAIEGNALLLRATGDMHWRHDAKADISSRLYLVDLETAAVALVGYHDAEDQIPRQ